MQASKHVLLVDDEKRIREVVEYALDKSGYRVTAVSDGALALAALARDPADLVVLDIMLPGLDGWEVCRRIRQQSAVPILFLSARGDEVDRIVGLELGGDDYLVKPFSPRELVARVRAILRRFEAGSLAAAGASAPLAARARLEHGEIEIDAERFEVRFAGQLLVLTPTEFTVLAALFERPGIVLSRAQLLQRIHSDVHVTERTLDSHVRRIRAKFKSLGADPIVTVHGVGYKAAQTDRTE
jgi:two-component system OmpR family response regulator